MKPFSEQEAYVPAVNLLARLYEQLDLPAAGALYLLVTLPAR